MTPPSIDDPSMGEMWELLGVGRKFRALPRRDAFRLLRWGPMAVADLVSEFFETELLRAVVAARGIYGAFAGPWSAGTALGVVLQAASDSNAAGPATFVRGGMGALTQALAAAARGFGAEVRTGATVARVATKDGRASGVVLSTGEEVLARAVVSNADPKRTLLTLVDPVELDPDFIWKMQNYRSKGAIAKVNLALSGLPEFPSAEASGGQNALAGRIHIGPEIDYLERAYDAAKYGDFSPHPYCDVTIPTLTDPSLAPAGKHVMSIVAQFAPYKLKSGDWKAKRDALGDSVVDAVAAYAPNLKGLVTSRQVLTPAGPRGHVRPDRRSRLPRRRRHRPALHDAPAARLGAVPDAGQGPLPLRLGHAPRRRRQRRPGLERQPRGRQGPARALLARQGFTDQFFVGASVSFGVARASGPTPGSIV